MVDQGWFALWGRCGAASSPWRGADVPGTGATVPGAPRLRRLQLDIEWGEGGPRQRLQVASLRLVAGDGTAP